jgi:hypothetical protein
LLILYIVAVIVIVIRDTFLGSDNMIHIWRPIPSHMMSNLESLRNSRINLFIFIGAETPMFFNRNYSSREIVSPQLINRVIRSTVSTFGRKSGTWMGDDLYCGMAVTIREMSRVCSSEGDPPRPCATEFFINSSFCDDGSTL